MDISCATYGKQETPQTGIGKNQQTRHSNIHSIHVSEGKYLTALTSYYVG